MVAMESVDQLQMLHETIKLWVIMDKIEKDVDIPEVRCEFSNNLSSE